MKLFYFLAVSAILVSGCQKQKPVEAVLPQMNYTDLADVQVPFGSLRTIDLNGDQQADIYFGTQLVGDPLSQSDKKQWLIGSSYYVSLPVNEAEQVPAMQAGQQIPIIDFSGYHWYNASSVLLAQKVISTSETRWEGNWKDILHRFIPVQLSTAAGLYNGWVEISFSTTAEQLTLHRAALSRETNKDVKAGK